MILRSIDRSVENSRPSAPFRSNSCGHHGCGRVTTASVTHTGTFLRRQRCSSVTVPGHKLHPRRPRRRRSVHARVGGRRSRAPEVVVAVASPRVTPMPCRAPGLASPRQGAWRRSRGLVLTRPCEFQAAPRPGAASVLNLAPLQERARGGSRGRARSFTSLLTETHGAQREKTKKEFARALPSPTLRRPGRPGLVALGSVTDTSRETPLSSVLGRQS